MHLIERGLCRLAPSVAGMWLDKEGRYATIYTQEELKERTEEAARALESLPDVKTRRKLKDAVLVQIIQRRVADGSAWLEHGELPRLAFDALECGLVAFPEGVRYVVQNPDETYEAISEEQWQAKIKALVDEELRFDVRKQLRKFKADLDKYTVGDGRPISPWWIALVAGAILFLSKGFLAALLAAIGGFSVQAYRIYRYGEASKDEVVRAAERAKPKYLRVVESPRIQNEPRG